MKKKLLHIILFFSFSLSTVAQKKEKASTYTETAPPDWVSKRPLSSSKYIGIGVASKTNPDYQFEAKKNALYDLASEIKVNISSNSMLYSVQNDNKFSQTFNFLVNLKGTENIEGYELVDTYENEKQYWVYYQLDKKEYFKQKEQKKKNTVTKAAELIKLSIIDDNQKNYSTGLRKKIQAFSILVPYLNEEINFSEYDIPNIKNIFDLITEIQSKLQSINIIPPQTIPIIKPYQQKYNPIQIKTLIYKDILSQFPFILSYNDEVIETQDKSVSDNKGVLNIFPIYVQAGFQITNIEIQPDIDALVQNDSIGNQNIKFLKSFIQLPKFSIPISIQPINVYIQTKELNMNKVSSSQVIKNLLFNKIKTNEISIVSDSAQADYIIKIYSNTFADDNNDDLKKQFNLYLAQLSIDINLYDKNKQILFNQTINNIYGYGSNLQSAGNNAYNSKKLVDLLNEAFFHMKRKIVWY